MKTTLSLIFLLHSKFQSNCQKSALYSVEQFGMADSLNVGPVPVNTSESLQVPSEPCHSWCIGTNLLSLNETVKKLRSLKKFANVWKTYAAKLQPNPPQNTVWEPKKTNPERVFSRVRALALRFDNFQIESKHEMTTSKSAFCAIFFLYIRGRNRAYLVYQNLCCSIGTPF